MNSIINLTSGQLRQAADLQDKIQSLQSELAQLLGAAPAAAVGAGPAPKRRLSARAIANIRAGARKRWAKERGAQGAAEPGRKRKRKISAAGRAALSAAAKARWAKARASGKAHL